MRNAELWRAYLAALEQPFVKLARLRFLNPDGSTAFVVDNNPLSKRSSAFFQEGSLSVNLNNGQRRTASVTLSNLDNEYDYNVNSLWFGQQVALDEGLILPDGTEFYLPQGVFYIKEPQEALQPGRKTTTLNLADKWAYLDGTLFGRLEGIYEVPRDSYIYAVIASILKLPRGNGLVVDNVTPIFTPYFNGKTQLLTDGTTAELVRSPYTYRCDSTDGTYADIILEMNTMLAGWIGYDQTGALRLDPSQDDILDINKPVMYNFSPLNSNFLGASYTVQNSSVYNDIIIEGETFDDYSSAAGRATNFDPASDTNVNRIGFKTYRESRSGYATDRQCQDLAMWKLKRMTVLTKSVTISCSQMFHIVENKLVTITRTDKKGSPVERHLVTGFSRPLAQTGEMTLNCTSVLDFPMATLNKLPYEA